MNSIDTFTKRFLEAGFDEHQAEALASALREVAALATESERSGVPTNVDFAAKSKSSDRLTNDITQIRVEVATIISGLVSLNEGFKSDLRESLRKSLMIFILAAGLINVAALLALMQILSTVLLGRNLFEELFK
jgi:hypothetical protein